MDGGADDSSSSSLASGDGYCESDSCGATTSADESSTSWTSTTSSPDGSGGTDESDEQLSSASSVSSSLQVVSALLDDECQCDCHRTSSNVDNDVDDSYSSKVRDWTDRVPIGMNLCPWAKLSQKEDRIRYVTCHENIRSPGEASKIVWKEIEKLLGGRELGGFNDCVRNHHQSGNRSHPPWSTTLVICPHVEAWKEDFETFDAFVKNFGNDENDSSSIHQASNGTERPSKQPQRHATLVPFHPHFVRWRGLPESISTGSKVRCHKGLAGFSKSPEAHPATVIDLRPAGFGRRRIKVRFHNSKTNDENENENEHDEPARSRIKAEQCVPVDWVLLDDPNRRPLLPDNAMHRAPYPVIHILRNEDLAALSIHEISRLKRRNAKRMASEKLL